MLIDLDGRFCGYASRFDLPDQSRDVVMPGAFANSLKSKPASRIRLLFQHDPKEPIGKFENVREDQTGLYVEGQLLDLSQRGAELKGLIAQGAIDGLSIGFRTLRATRDRAKNLRRLWQIDIWEISIVTFPMMEQARILPRRKAMAAKPYRQTKPQPCAHKKLDAAITLMRSTITQ